MYANVRWFDLRRHKCVNRSFNDIIYDKIAAHYENSKLALLKFTKDTF